MLKFSLRVYFQYVINYSQRTKIIHKIRVFTLSQHNNVSSFLLSILPGVSSAKRKFTPQVRVQQETQF